MKICAIYLLLLVVAGWGCSSRNISKQEPFAAYIGRPVELNDPVAIVKRRSIWFGHSGVLSLHHADFGLKHITYADSHWLGYVYANDRVFAKLPPGQTVYIDRVLDEIIIDGEYILAYGHTTLPHTTHEVTFVYIWGFGHLWNLERAPWEPESVPARRKIRE